MVLSSPSAALSALLSSLLRPRLLPSLLVLLPPLLCKAQEKNKEQKRPSVSYYGYM